MTRQTKQRKKIQDAEELVKQMDFLPDEGLWDKGKRLQTLRKLRFKPEDVKGEWVWFQVPSPKGVVRNGIRIKGKQYLPKAFARSILAQIHAQMQVEEKFRNGGKKEFTYLGRLSG